ncbi:amidohydrolase [Nocardia nova]|uniref:Amidohydrolase n=1 Tax=Nocardia nova TaxID=37330 RepID=A0A2S6AVS2_9NOCA|nr:amidohydrolase family protein [Nocardia nova]PPJ33552.1 amidohydrolase [Nocardia nova]PPJ39345.1 amidohydrolase [Nocardia nova]
MTVIVIRNAEVRGQTGLDLRVRGSRLEQIGRGLSTSDAQDVIDARGGAVIPGLHDHHLHLYATAADAASVHCGPPEVCDRQELADALAMAAGDEHGWVRGVGYFESVAGDLDARAIDALHRDRPVRIQHRSGAMWILNTAALRQVRITAATRHPGVELDAAGEPTGRIWRADSWLRDRLPAAGPPDLHALGAKLARKGITGVTDATPDLTPGSQTALTQSVATGELPQRLHLLGVPLNAVVQQENSRVSVGPYKIVIPDSGLPSLDNLVERIRCAHGHGRAVAVHCVSREALLLLLAAMEEAGGRAGDRIEHGALIPVESIADIRRHGFSVVTQPGFLRHRGDDYRHTVDAADLPDLYRCRSLVDAGVPLALSSDAPYGPIDPWTVIAAARDRAGATGAPLNIAEHLTAGEALRAYLGSPDDPGGLPRRLRAGAPADLVVLEVPLARALSAPTADNVRATVIDGHIFWRTT